MLRAARARRRADRVVRLTGHEDVSVRLEDTALLTARQLRTRALWMEGREP